MIEDSRVRKHIPGILLLVSLAIAAGAFAVWPPRWEVRTLFFPGATTAELSGERRLVPRSSEPHKEIRLVVEEMILGPADIRHGRLLPRETRIASLALAGETVYVDLSPEMIFGEEEVRVNVPQGLNGIEQTLLYNFRWLETVVLTIGGQEPFEPAYFAPEDSAG